MTFLAVPGRPPLEGLLRYVEAEHSFTFDVASPAELQERTGTRGVTSLSVGTLQIEVGIETGAVLFAWGLNPRTAWYATGGRRPKPAMTGARVETVDPLQRGVTLELAGAGEWVTMFDEETGWVLVTARPHRMSEHDLLVATGVALGTSNGELDAIWLQPIFE
jgi:hypothetical protein